MLGWRARIRILAAMLAAVAMAATGRAGEAPSQLQSHQTASPALGRALAYSIYLPPGYTAGEGRYPVIYLLHGVGDDETAWPVLGGVKETADRLIAAGSIHPLIIVMPAAGQSWYVDSAALGGPGDYATAIGGDLVAHVDATYRTQAARHGRAVAGLSMGAYGALRFAFLEPERYSAVAAMSPALWLRVQRDGVAVPEEVTRRVFRGAFGVPFSPERFKESHPWALIEGLTARGTPPAVFISAGDDDRFNLFNDAIDTFRRLRAAALPAELRITDGDHDWPTWARTLADVLVFFDAHFANGRRS